MDKNVECESKTIPSTDSKTLDEIDTIELAISEIVNENNNLDDVAGNSISEHANDDDSNFIEVIETQTREETEEDSKARVALQQLESINLSSRRKKKNDVGSIISTKKNQPSNNDLIAILQGDDIGNSDIGDSSAKEVLIEGEGQYHLLDIEENDENDKQENLEITDSSLPPKNRKRKQDFKSDLVSSLASEWSDEEDGGDIPKISTKSKEEESPPTTTKTENETLDPKIPEITPFKRTRVIKRKIIWDPDAPDQFSYASLIQPKNKTSPNQTKEQIKKRVASPVRRKQINSPADNKLEITEKKQKNVSLPTKKKKLSEVDRLLGDEGAANMLNSLEQQSENASNFDNKNKRAVVKTKPSEHWDYVYNSTSVDSMIARRRSTSSFSSTTSPHRNSFDATPPNANRTKSSKSNETKKKTSKNFEFAKPEAKIASKRDDEDDDNIENYDMVHEIKKSVEKKKINENAKQKEGGNKNKKDGKDLDDVVVKKNGNVYNVLVDTKSSRSRNMFTIKMLNKIIEILNDLRKDNDCRVVLFSSSGQNFCQGLDYSELVNTTEKRNQSCQDWSKTVYELFQTLIKFPKPTIAAVQGNASGLGVMMIPLFDITICSEKSTFETNYMKSGQYPEGFCLLNATLQNNLVKRLIWLGEKINSSDAVVYGLITKTSTPQKISEEALNCAKKMSTYSQETFVNMKNLRFSNIGTNKLLNQLDEDESKFEACLISDIFCENYKHFLSKGSW